MIPFDLPRFVRGGFGGHGGRIGLAYHDHGADWCELALPWREDLVGDVDAGTIASGPIVAMLDVAASLAIWQKRGHFIAHATLDLRVDYLRPTTSGRTVIGRGECYRLTPSVSFVRGAAHDGDPADPVAHVAGTYMTLAPQA